MIIECQACQTRFRLDETKITGKGARIRCRRCGESIIVMKSDISPPVVSPPAGKEFFDLRAVLEETARKRPAPPRDQGETAMASPLFSVKESEPPAEEEPSTPAADLERETQTQEPVETPDAPGPAPRDVIATPFEAPSHEDREPETLAQEPGESLLSHDEVETAMASPLFSVEEGELPAEEEPSTPAADLEREAQTQEPVETPDAPGPAPRDHIAPPFEAPSHEDREPETLTQEPEDAPHSHGGDEADMASPLFSVEEGEPPAEEEPSTPAGDLEREAPTQEPVETPDAPGPAFRDDIATPFEETPYEDREPETLTQEPEDAPLSHGGDEADIASSLFSVEEGEPPAEEEPALPPGDKDLLDLRAIFGGPEEKTDDPLRDEADTAMTDPLFSEEGEPPAADETPSTTDLEREAPMQEPVETPDAPVPAPRDDIATPFEETPYEDREPETLAQEPEDAPLSHGGDEAAMASPLFSEEEGEPPAEEEPSTPAGDLEREVSTQEPEDAHLSHGGDEAAITSPLFSEEEGEPPAEEEPAPPPVDGELLDLRSIIGGPGEKTQDPLRDEADTAMAGPLFSEEGSETHAAEEPSPPPGGADTPFPLELEKEEEISFIPVTGEIPVRDLRELTDQAPKVPTSPMERAREQIHESEEFLKLETVLPDFLRKEGATAKSAGPFDISEHLTSDPIGTEDEDKAPVPPTPDLPLFSEEAPFSRADAMHEEMSDLAENGPVEETYVPEPPPPGVPPPIPLEVGKMQATHPRPVPSGRPSIALLLVLFVTLAGGGAYLAFTKAGQETVRTLVPGMESLWLGGKGSVRPYHVGNLIGYYEMSEKAGKMFIIKGVATNQGRSKKSGIRIRAELLNSNQQTIAEKTVYAGNIVAGLRYADPETIEAAMSNRFGDRLSNLDVEPGRSVPFMVAFFNPPEGIEEYRLEALDGD